MAHLKLTHVPAANTGNADLQTWQLGLRYPHDGLNHKNVVKIK